MLSRQVLYCLKPLCQPFLPVILGYLCLSGVLQICGAKSLSQEKFSLQYLSKQTERDRQNKALSSYASKQRFCILGSLCITPSLTSNCYLSVQLPFGSYLPYFLLYLPLSTFVYYFVQSVFPFFWSKNNSKVY
jgi:hypothetical protein